MAVTLTFDGLKAAGISNSRPWGACDKFHFYMQAQSYQELIDAAIPDMVYLYRTGIVTDELLAEVDEALLNENGLYTTTQIAENPLYEIFVFGVGDLTLTLNNSGRFNVNVLKNANLNLDVSNNSWVQVTFRQFATGDITIHDTSVACIEVLQNSALNLTQEDTSISQLVTAGDTSAFVTVSGSSFSKINGYGHSIIHTFGSGVTDVRLYERSSNPLILV